MIALIKEQLLNRFTAEVRYSDGNIETVEGSGIVSHKENDDGAVWFLSYQVPADVTLSCNDTLTFTLGPKNADKIHASHHDNRWWMISDYPEAYTSIPAETQNLLLKLGNDTIHLLPLCGDDFSAEFIGDKLVLSCGANGKTSLHGAFLACAKDQNGLAAVEKSFRAARALGGIRVPLLQEKNVPDMFESFGWCSWDAFYRNVTADGILAKAEELKQKGIPFKWMLIDDGWMQNDDTKLQSFLPDESKFPGGFAPLVRRLKEEYGVRYVGVWHTLNAYWKGIDVSSRLYEEEKENLFINPQGMAIPSLDPEKAFAFFDHWYTEFEKAGIDFVKVDNQSSYSGYLHGCIPPAEGCRNIHSAIERAVEKHFNGRIINCMGMDRDNVLARCTAVSRNSDDFFPMRERGFVKHLLQNAGNTIWHNQLYVCDFDMWWSDHESSVQSGVLRAVSGSPVYVSDKVGHSDAQAILPVIAPDACIDRMDHALLPTLDCLYTDFKKENRLLKVWNRSGDAFAAAAFQVSDLPTEDVFHFGEIPGLDNGKCYMSYEYFSKKWQKIDSETKISVSLPVDGVCVWAIYPIHNDGAGDYIFAGDTNRYCPIASSCKKLIMVSDIL